MSGDDGMGDRNSETDDVTSAANDEVSTRHLIAQANAAAEQAIELSRLAVDSARLAEQLNVQVLQRTGRPVSGLEAASAESSPAQGGLPTLVSTASAQFLFAVVVPAIEAAQRAADAESVRQHLTTLQKALGAAIRSQLQYADLRTETLDRPAPNETPGSGAFAGLAAGDDQPQRSSEPPIDSHGTSSNQTENYAAKDASVSKSGGRYQTACGGSRRGHLRHGLKKKNALDRIREHFIDERHKRRCSEAEGSGRWFVRRWKSVAISTGLHLAGLVALGLITLTVTAADEPLSTIIASFAEDEAVVEEDLPVEQLIQEPGEQQQEEHEEEEPEQKELLEDEPQEMDELGAESPDMESDQPAAPETSDAAMEPAFNFKRTGTRSAAAKKYLLEKYGGTAASESAVQRALEWLVNMQRQDGSWNFNDVRSCSGAGEIDNPMGATSYALLTFLGAGQTHREGRFRANVRAGLDFLLQHGRMVPAGADLRGLNCREHDNFYVQGAAAAVLCEAYSMTKDRRLRSPAEGAIRFISLAQDPRGGGWRYAPREPGCTSVTGLQLLALMTAKKAGIRVARRIFDGVSHYLDTVRSDRDGSGRYGYTVGTPRYKSSTTAIALLCRMHLGWERNHPELINGVRVLDERGPYDNLYYCYYTTQVLRHWGGAQWRRWNDVMREELVRTQTSREGAEYGSWPPRDRSDFSSAGGRLFVTCLCALTLEVYYRYEPIYGLPGPQRTLAVTHAD